MRESANQYSDVHHFMPGAIERSAGLCPLRIGRNIAKANYRVGPKRIECFSVHFVVSGRVRVGNEEVTATLEAGDLFAMYPGRSYTYETASGGELLQMRWLAFQGAQSELLLKEIGLSPERPFVRGRVTAQVKELMDLLIDEALQETGKTLKARMERLSGLYFLFGLLLPDRDEADFGIDAAGVSQWKAYMDTHFAEAITVEAVAARFGVHRSHLTARFTRETGVAPMKYLQRLRLGRGAELLKQTGLSVTEIALSLGYPDLYSFTRAFRNYYGKSPTEYRELDRLRQVGYTSTIALEAGG